MNKPDWKDAPAWANYLAQDSDGGWYWYSNIPAPNKENGLWGRVDGYYTFALFSGNNENPNWQNTLEHRSKEEPKVQQEVKKPYPFNPGDRVFFHGDGPDEYDEGTVMKTAPNGVNVRWDGDGRKAWAYVHEVALIHPKPTEQIPCRTEQEAVMMLLNLGYTITKSKGN